MPAHGQNTGLPRDQGACVYQHHAHPGYGLPQTLRPFPDLCPSFLEGEGAAAEGSQEGPEAQPLLVACLWYFSPGQEAQTSSISLPRIPGHLPSQSPWDLFVFGLGLFVLHTHPPHPPPRPIPGPLDPVLLSGPDLWESSRESDL